MISPAHPPDALRPIAARMPSRPPGPGEQYRFHFDMGKCIGCKCCVVACNEQNGNPAAINWRRVGEIEGGWYPHTHALYLSMGCNHCLEPTCMSGCPVDAYHEGRGDRDRAAQRRYLYRLPGTARGTARTACRSTTLSAASSASATVSQPSRDRTVAGVRLGLSVRGDSGRNRQVADWRAAVAASCAAPACRSADQSVSTTRMTLPEICRRTRVRSISCSSALGAALVARHHDDADAALRRCTRHDLAAASARRLDAARPRGAHLGPGRRPGARARRRSIWAVPSMPTAR